jgi:chemotaxis protein methyltransferase CheR
MTDEVFGRFYTLLEQKTGISLDSTKQYLIESRLSSISKTFQHESIPELVRTLVQSPVGELHWRAFEALTTNETMFFRDKLFFEVLVGSIIPKLIRSKKDEKALRISCAAVSTGQEAYSIAIALKENFPELADWNVYIQASDISTQALDRARLAVYTQTEVERGLDAYFVQKYLTKIGKDKYQVIPAIREAVTFLPANLLDAPAAYPKFDLVMLRNVLIYFGQATKERVLERIRRQMHSADSVLALGSTETIYGNPNFKMVQYGKISCYTPV